MNCLRVLRDSGMDLSRYSFDFLVELEEHSGTYEECVSLMEFLEAEYG